MSTRRRTLGIYASKTPLGPNGERLCRNCRKVLEKGQRHNCSPKCSDEWMCKTSPGILRSRLRERDKGVCAICGVDTIALKLEYREFCQIIKRFWVEMRTSPLPPGAQLIGHEYCMRSWDERIPWLKTHGIPAARQCGDWWDADHIVPVVEGGGECGLENFRTLCIPCHKSETAKLRQRMKQRRVEAKPLPLLDSHCQI